MKDILSLLYAFDMVSAFVHFPVCPPLYGIQDRQVFIRVRSRGAVEGESWGLEWNREQGDRAALNLILTNAVPPLSNVECYISRDNG